MRKEPDYFGDQELALIYVAKKLKEALALEEALTAAGVDYLVEPDRYTGGIIFRTERVGAFFYVAPGSEEAARRLMKDRGYRPYESLGRDIAKREGEGPRIYHGEHGPAADQMSEASGDEEHREGPATFETPKTQREKLPTPRKHPRNLDETDGDWGDDEPEPPPEKL